MQCSAHIAATSKPFNPTLPEWNEASSIFAKSHGCDSTTDKLELPVTEGACALFVRHRETHKILNRVVQFCRYMSEDKREYRT